MLVIIFKTATPPTPVVIVDWCDLGDGVGTAANVQICVVTYASSSPAGCCLDKVQL